MTIPPRDGTFLYGDVFRPGGGTERFPVIMNTGPYQKDKVWVPPASVEEKPNPYMNWETANPLRWCRRGEPGACLTKGWLRASHRKLDPARSLPYRPYHAHNQRQWLKPGESVECQVEIWPTSMVFNKGHKLRLDITPCDAVGTAHFTHYSADYNTRAENAIYAGGDRTSYLLLPVIPAK